MQCSDSILLQPLNSNNIQFSQFFFFFPLFCIVFPLLVFLLRYLSSSQTSDPAPEQHLFFASCQKHIFFLEGTKHPISAFLQSFHRVFFASILMLHFLLSYFICIFLWEKHCLSEMQVPNPRRSQGEHIPFFSPLCHYSHVLLLCAGGLYP